MSNIKAIKNIYLQEIEDKTGLVRGIQLSYLCHALSVKHLEKHIFDNCSKHSALVLIESQISMPAQCQLFSFFEESIELAQWLNDIGVNYSSRPYIYAGNKEHYENCYWNLYKGDNIISIMKDDIKSIKEEILYLIENKHLNTAHLINGVSNNLYLCGCFVDEEHIHYIDSDNTYLENKVESYGVNSL
jgi:hypothetical protein